MTGFRQQRVKIPLRGFFQPSIFNDDFAEKSADEIIVFKQSFNLV